MDIIRLYQDYTIEFVTEGHKHSRPGWVNTECPWCTGNPGYHLGFDIAGSYYYCWRCGWHPTAPTVAKLLRIQEREARELLRHYGLLLSSLVYEGGRQDVKQAFAFPSSTSPLHLLHRKYLEGRGYDPDVIERIWRIQSTGPTSKLGEVIYKNRILIPFFWNGEVVSFDTRSISNTLSHQLRYKACPKNREQIPHKQILYGLQEEWRETGICVEGPTDVWRLGTCSFATSGVQFTTEQLRIMARTFKRIAIWYDEDEAGVKQGLRLAAELRDRGVHTKIITQMGTDPGGMRQEDADYQVKQIMRWK